MKKTLAMLLVLALVAPAMAVTFTASDAGSGVLKIDYTLASGEVLRGLALKLTRTSGDAAVAAGTDVAAPAFNTFIDYAFSNAGYQIGQGHPVAKVDGAGVPAPEQFPINTFSISVGFLDQAGAQAGITANGSITVQLTGTADSCFDIELDTLRGGVVGDNVVAPAAGWKINQCVVLKTTPVCTDKLTATQLALYNRYVTAGKDPSCWCWQFQCYGDASNSEEGTLTKYRIYNADLTLMLNSWAKKPETGADPRCDFNHAEEGTLTKYSVYNADLTILLQNWAKKTSQLTNCATYIAK